MSSFSPLTVTLMLAFAIIALVIGYKYGDYKRGQFEQNARDEAHQSADEILKQARLQAKADQKEALLEAKEEAQRYRNHVEEDLDRRRDEAQEKEERLFKREENLDRRDTLLSEKENTLASKEQSLQDRQKNVIEKETRVEELLASRQEELEKISQLSEEQAKTIILNETEQKLDREIVLKLREARKLYEERSDKIAQSIILQAIETNGVETVQDNSTTRVDLPNDDMKGRIIGKDGRNIKAIEALTGIDLIIDDTPEIVVLSGFDPIRREIANIALQSLIKDGRIHPARIEEAVDRARKEMDKKIRDQGEAAVFDLGIHNMHPDLIRFVGRLAYRSSYGQNVLQHSMEVARISGTIAAEIGENEMIAKRAGLLHDLGKAIDHEVEGTHVEIGVELAEKYSEDPVIINAIASHHGDVKQTSNIAVIVQIADALSAARPGARNESLENYVQRLRELEAMANQKKGVEHAFAIQAGREIRVMVHPDKIDDLQSEKLAHDLAEEIQNEMEYPGQIKVTVIRETRAIDYAK